MKDDTFLPTQIGCGIYQSIRIASYARKTLAIGSIKSSNQLKVP